MTPPGAIGSYRGRMRTFRLLPGAAWTRADVAVAVVVYVVTVVTTVASEGRWETGTVTIAAVACGMLALRRAYPFLTLVITAVAAEAYLVLMHGGVLVLAAPLVALYTVAESTSSGRALTIGILGVAAFLSVHELFKPTAWLGAENLALAAFGGVALAAGHAARSRRAYLAEVEARAAHAEADRDAEAARRVAEERLRIARDLHDDIGQYLALIHVQAKVADHLLDAEPGPARAAIGHVREASRTALGQLSDTVALLRRPDEPGVAPEVLFGDAASPIPPGGPADHRTSGRRCRVRAGGDGPHRVPGAPGVPDERLSARGPDRRRRRADLLAGSAEHHGGEPGGSVLACPDLRHGPRTGGDARADHRGRRSVLRRPP